jgi:hypothetical protein
LNSKSLRTFTTLSHPQDTITGFNALGLKRTHETLHNSLSASQHNTSPSTHHSECPSSLISNLHSPSVFQSLIVRSRLPDTICLLSALKLTDKTSEVWPMKRRVVSPVFRSHRRRVWSQDEERANWPSEEMTMSETKWLCPWRMRLG